MPARPRPRARRKLALALLVLCVLPTPLAGAADLGAVQDELLLASLFVDGAVAPGTLSGPVDGPSAAAHRWALPGGAELHVLAVGVNRGVVDPHSSTGLARAFHTTTAADAFVENGRLTEDGTVTVILVCRVVSAGVALPCRDVAVRARLGWAYAAAADLPTASTTSADGSTSVAYDPAASAARVHAYPAEWSLGTLGAWNGWTTGAAHHLERHSLLLVPFAAARGQLNGLNTTAAAPKVALVEAQLEARDAAGVARLAGALREPVWRVAKGPVEAAEPLAACARPWPGLDAMRAWRAGSGAPEVDAWARSCRAAAAGAEPRLRWADVLAPGEPSPGAGELARRVAARLAAVHAGAPGAPPLVPARADAARLLSVEVRDGEAWVAPADAERVAGGPTRFTLLVDGWWTTAGLPHGARAGEATVARVVVAPDPPSLDHVGVRIASGAVPFLGGTVLAQAPAEGSGLAVVTAPGVAGAPTLAHWSDAGGRRLRACAEEAWSHNVSGPWPNVPGADRLALAPVRGGACADLAGLVRLALPRAPASAVLEIRTGDAFALEVVAPSVPAARSLAAVSSAGADPQRVRVPVGALGDGAAPWSMDHPVAGALGPGRDAFAARVVATLPRSATPAQLADAALELAWTFRANVGTVAIEIEDLPATPRAAARLDGMRDLAPAPAVLVPAGRLPAATWALDATAKLMTIHGLAARADVLTVGSGSTVAGADAWSRRGPTADLRAKPDFAAPAPAGSTAAAVANVVPLVEALHLAGVFGPDAVRAGLAAMALPAPGTFYEVGYGVLDVTPFLAERLARDGHGDAAAWLAPSGGWRAALPERAARAFEAAPAPAGLAAPRAQHAVAGDGARAWIVGGVEGAGPTDRVLRHDPGAAAPVPAGRLPVARAGAAAAVADGRLWVAGGANGWLLKDVLHLDPATGSFLSANGTLPSGRRDAAAASDGARLWIVGGCPDAACRAPLDEVVRVDAVARRVDGVVARLPYGVAGATAWHDGRHLWILGGRTAGGFTDAVLRLDPATGAVERAAAVLPSPRAGMAAAPWAGGLALVGGEGPAGRLAEIARFDPAAERVLLEPAVLPRARAGAGAAVVDGVLRVYGGTGAQGALADALAWKGAPGVLAGPGAPRADLAALARDPRAVDEPGDVLGAALPPGAFDVFAPGGPGFLALDPPLVPLTPVADWGVANWETRTPARLKLLDLGAVLAAARDAPVEPKTVRVASRHFDAFELLDGDLVAEGRGLLLAEAGLPAPATTATPRRLTEDTETTVGALVRVLGATPCPGLDAQAEWAEGLRRFVAAAEAQLGRAHAARGLAYAVGPEMPPLAVSGDCALDVPSLQARLVELRERLEAFEAGHESLAAQPAWGRAVDPAVAEGLVARTLAALGLPAAAADTSLTLDEVLDRLEVELAAVDAQVRERDLRLAPARVAETRMPRLTLWTDTAATAEAPLGPWLGFTVVTTRDVAVVNPLTGEPLAGPDGAPLARDVAVPLPSALWNNPTLEVALEWRGDLPIPGTGLTLHDPDFQVFSRVVRENLTIDGVVVPLADALAAAAAPAADDRRARLEAAGARLSAAGADDAAAALASRAVARLAAASPGAPGVEDLGDALAALFSKPLTQGGVADAASTIRMGEAFPASAWRAYYPYAYFAGHRLEQDLPAEVAGGGAVAPLADADRAVARAVRDAFVGEDGAAAPDEPPRWAHNPDPLPTPAPVDAAAYTYGPVEIHDGAVPGHHRFELRLRGGHAPEPLACLALRAHASAFALPFAAPACGAAGPSPEDVAAAVCAETAPAWEAACRGALGSAARDEPDARASCEAALGRAASCATLLSAFAAARAAAAAVAPADAAPVPFARGLRAGALAAQSGAVPLEDLVQRAVGANPGVPEPRVRAAVATALADLPALVRGAAEVGRPPRVAHDTYQVAQALVSHGGDKVTGLDWCSAVLPGAITAETAREVAALAARAAERLTDPADRAWGQAVAAELAAADPAELAARLAPPTFEELRARSPPARPGDPLAGGENGAPWRQCRPPQGVDVLGQPGAVDVPAAEAWRALAGTGLEAAVPPTGALPSVDPAAGAAWASAVEAAAVLQAARPEGEDAVEVARRLVALLPGGGGWRVDRGADAARATWEAPGPRAGVLAYTIPLAPQEHVQVRTSGEWHFRNSDAFLVVTPHDVVKDALLAAARPVSEALAATTDPTLRPVAVAETIDHVLRGTGAHDDAYLRVRHLNPLVRAEHDAALEPDGTRRDVTLALWGGMRARSAVDAFEFGTRAIDEHQFGFDELHFVVVWFPLLDSATAASVRGWLNATAGAPVPAEALQSSFGVADFGVMWDTYVGMPAASQAGFPSPWAPGVEDLKLYWAVPDVADVRVDFLAGAATLTEADAARVARPAFAGGWDALCGDATVAGKWYTPSLAGPRGVAGAAPGFVEGVWGEGEECRANDVRGLLPAKEPGSGRARPVLHRIPAADAVAALEYDARVEGLTLEERPAAAPLFEPASLRGRLAGLLPRCPVQPAARCADVGAWPHQAATLALDAGKAASRAAAPVAGAFGSLPAGAALADAGPEDGYVRRPTAGTGAGAGASHWLVLDAADLARLAGGASTRPGLAVRDASSGPRAAPPVESALPGQAFALTQRFDPARVVAVVDAARAPDGAVDAGMTLLDGFAGRGVALAVQAREAEPGGPLVVERASAGLAAGGSPAWTESDGRRVRATPPGACWDFPQAERALAHATCWSGAWSDDLGADALASCAPQLSGFAAAARAHGLARGRPVDEPFTAPAPSAEAVVRRAGDAGVGASWGVADAMAAVLRCPAVAAALQLDDDARQALTIDLDAMGARGAAPPLPPAVDLAAAIPVPLRAARAPTEPSAPAGEVRASWDPVVGVRLAWSLPPGETSVRLHRSIAGGPEEPVVEASTDGTAVDDDLRPKTAYRYVLRDAADGELRASSDVATPAAPAPPAQARVALQPDGTVRVAWEGPAGVEVRAWRVERADAPGAWQAVADVDAGELAWTDPAPPSGAAWRVRAVGVVGAGEPTAAVGAT